jgi:hypothetical protein
VGRSGIVFLFHVPPSTYRLSFPLELWAVLERGLRLDNVGGVHVGLVVHADAVNGPVMMCMRQRFDQHHASCPSLPPSLSPSTYFLMPWKRWSCS